MATAGGQWQTQPGGGRTPNNGLGTAALVVGIIALLTAVLLIGLPLGILAVIFGIIGLKRVNRGEATNRGASIAGIVLGALAVVLAGALIAAGAAFFIENEDEIENFGDCLDQAEDEAARQACGEEFEQDVEDG